MIKQTIVTGRCAECLHPYGHCLWCSQLSTTDAAPVPLTTPAQNGWLCPACGRGNAPTNPTCPCKGYPKMEITCGPATMG
jgi:hypothetical protein